MATASNRETARPASPITIAEAMPKIGVINGAISMAAMTTPAEFRNKPAVATMTAIDSKMENLTQ